MAGLRPEHPNFDGPPWQEAVRAADGWGEPREIRVTVSQPADPERDPRPPRLDELGRRRCRRPSAREVLEQFRSLLAGGQTPAELPFHVLIGLAAPQSGVVYAPADPAVDEELRSR